MSDGGPEAEPEPEIEQGTTVDPAPITAVGRAFEPTIDIVENPPPYVPPTRSQPPRRPPVPSQQYQQRRPVVLPSEVDQAAEPEPEDVADALGGDIHATTGAILGDVRMSATGEVLPPQSDLPPSITIDVTVVLTVEQRRAIEPEMSKLWPVVDEHVLPDPEVRDEVKCSLEAAAVELKSPHPKLAVVSSSLRSVYAALKRAVVTPQGMVAVNVASTAIYNLTVHGHL